MVEKLLRQTSRKTWYRWSVYIYVLMFALVAIMIFFLTYHSMHYNVANWHYIVIDAVILTFALAVIMIQFFRNLFTIIKRSL